MHIVWDEWNETTVISKYSDVIALGKKRLQIKDGYWSVRMKMSEWKYPSENVRVELHGA